MLNALDKIVIKGCSTSNPGELSSYKIGLGAPISKCSNLILGSHKNSLMHTSLLFPIKRADQPKHNIPSKICREKGLGRGKWGNKRENSVQKQGRMMLEVETNRRGGFERKRRLQEIGRHLTPMQQRSSVLTPIERGGMGMGMGCVGAQHVRNTSCTVTPADTSDTSSSAIKPLNPLNPHHNSSIEDEYRKTRTRMSKEGCLYVKNNPRRQSLNKLSREIESMLGGGCMVNTYNRYNKNRYTPDENIVIKKELGAIPSHVVNKNPVLMEPHKRSMRNIELKRVVEENEESNKRHINRLQRKQRFLESKEREGEGEGRLSSFMSNIYGCNNRKRIRDGSGRSPREMKSWNKCGECALSTSFTTKTACNLDFHEGKWENCNCTVNMNKSIVVPSLVTYVDNGDTSTHGGGEYVHTGGALLGDYGGHGGHGGHVGHHGGHVGHHVGHRPLHGPLHPPTSGHSSRDNSTHPPPRNTITTTDIDMQSTLQRTITNISNLPRNISTNISNNIGIGETRVPADESPSNIFMANECTPLGQLMESLNRANNRRKKTLLELKIEVEANGNKRGRESRTYTTYGEKENSDIRELGDTMDARMLTNLDNLSLSKSKCERRIIHTHMLDRCTPQKEGKVLWEVGGKAPKTGNLIRLQRCNSQSRSRSRSANRKLSRSRSSTMKKTGIVQGVSISKGLRGNRDSRESRDSKDSKDSPPHSLFSLLKMGKRINRELLREQANPMTSNIYGRVPKKKGHSPQSTQSIQDSPLKPWSQHASPHKNRTEFFLEWNLENEGNMARNLIRAGSSPQRKRKNIYI